MAKSSANEGDEGVEAGRGATKTREPRGAPRKHEPARVAGHAESARSKLERALPVAAERPARETTGSEGQVRLLHHPVRTSR